jgi:hypothetical protein
MLFFGIVTTEPDPLLPISSKFLLLFLQQPLNNILKK